MESTTSLFFTETYSPTNNILMRLFPNPDPCVDYIDLSFHIINSSLSELFIEQSHFKVSGLL